MKDDIKNPSKYLGNELKYLKKVLNGESWSATGGSLTIELEREMAKNQAKCKLRIFLRAKTKANCAHITTF